MVLKDKNELIDLVLPINLTLDDLNISEDERKPKPTEVRVEVGHVHHKDGNWENNELNNRTLLCKDCHTRIHPQLGKNLRPPRSRKEAREERRLKKEKKQTDEERKNYYAQSKNF